MTSDQIDGPNVPDSVLLLASAVATAAGIGYNYLLPIQPFSMRELAQIILWIGSIATLALTVAFLCERVLFRIHQMTCRHLEPAYTLWWNDILFYFVIALLQGLLWYFARRSLLLSDLWTIFPAGLITNFLINAAVVLSVIAPILLGITGWWYESYRDPYAPGAYDFPKGRRRHITRPRWM